MLVPAALFYRLRLAAERDDQDREREFLQQALELLDPAGHPDSHRVRGLLAGLG